MFEINYVSVCQHLRSQVLLEEVRFTTIQILCHQHQIALMLLGILLLSSGHYSFTFSATDFITYSSFLTNLSSTPSLFSEDDLYHRKRKANRLPHLSLYIRMHFIFSPVQQRCFSSSSIKPILTIFESIYSTTQESHTIYHSTFFLNIQYFLNIILHISLKLHVIFNIIRPQAQ